MGNTASIPETSVGLESVCVKTASSVANEANVTDKTDDLVIVPDLRPSSTREQWFRGALLGGPSFPTWVLSSIPSLPTEPDATERFAGRLSDVDPNALFEENVVAPAERDFLSQLLIREDDRGDPILLSITQHPALWGLPDLFSALICAYVYTHDLPCPSRDCDGSMGGMHDVECDASPDWASPALHHMKLDQPRAYARMEEHFTLNIRALGAGMARVTLQRLVDRAE